MRLRPLLDLTARVGSRQLSAPTVFLYVLHLASIGRPRSSRFSPYREIHISAFIAPRTLNTRE